MRVWLLNTMISTKNIYLTMLCLLLMQPLYAAPPVSCNTTYGSVITFNEIQPGNYVELYIAQDLDATTLRSWSLHYIDKAQGNKVNNYIIMPLNQASGVFVYSGGTSTPIQSVSGTISAPAYVVIDENLLQSQPGASNPLPISNNQAEFILTTNGSVSTGTTIDYLYYYVGNGNNDNNTTTVSCGEKYKLPNASNGLCTIPNGGTNWQPCDETEGETNDGNSGSCTLGSFSITQDNYALACPQDRAAVNIVPYCDDGTTVKNDYAGTVNLSSDGSGTSFYTAMNGGSIIAGPSITFDGSSGLKTVYIYNNQEEWVRVTVTDTSADPDISATGNATDFRAYGFKVESSTSSLVCGNSNLNITALGQDASGNSCDVIEGFSGSKALQVSLSPHDSDMSGTSAVHNYNQSQTVNFVNGLASIGIDDVGYATVNVSHNSAPYDGSQFSAMSGSLSGLKIIPDNLLVTVRRASDAVLMNNIDPTVVTPVLKAGSGLFDVEVTARCSNDVTASNFTAAVELSANAPDFTYSGNLGPATTPSTAAVSGIANFSSLTYDEVGHFTLTATASDYLTSGNTISGSQVTGRFIPAQFSLISHSLAPSWACDFAYLGQANILVNYTLQALSGETIPGVTQNYESNHAKAIFSYVLENDNTGSGPAMSRFNPIMTYSSINWNNGEYRVNGLYSFNREASADGAFEPLRLGIKLTDDGETNADIGLANTLDLNALTATDCTSTASCDALEIGSINLKYGRLIVDNAYGPESLPLNNIKISTQYYDGSGFVLNDSDSCTTYDSVTSIDWPAATYSGLNNGDIESSGSAVFVNGLGSFDIHKTAAPALGPGNVGYVDYDFVTNDWLKFDWQGSGDVNPHPRASFGVYSRSKRLIYTREVY